MTPWVARVSRIVSLCRLYLVAVSDMHGGAEGIASIQRNMEARRKLAPLRVAAYACMSFRSLRTPNAAPERPGGMIAQPACS